VLGYAVSGMIQAFVPRARLVKLMGGADARSIGLSTLFGAISSSCSRERSKVAGRRLRPASKAAL